MQNPIINYGLSAVFNCTTNSDCGWLNTCVDSLCKHDDYVPLNTFYIIALFLIPITVGFSNICGVGEGGVKVPINMLLLNYSPEKASNLAYSSMVGAGLVNLILLPPLRHPNLNKPLLDYNLILVLLPPLMIGSIFGEVFNDYLPEIFGIAVMLVILSTSAFFQIKQGNLIRNKHLKDQEAPRKLLREQDLLDSEILTNARAESKPIFNQTRGKMEIVDAKTDEEIRNYQIFKELEAKDEQIIPWNKVIFILIIFVIIEAEILLRGGEGYESFLKISECSYGYWLFTVLLFVTAVVLSAVVKYTLSKENQLKELAKYFIDKQEIKYDNRNFIALWFLGLFAGILNGAIGMGAWLLIMPILISMNLNPRVAAGSVAMVRIFITQISVVKAFHDKISGLEWEDFGVYSILSFVGGLPITYFLLQYIRQSNKSYFVVYVLATLSIIILCSFFAYTGLEVYHFGFDQITSRGDFCGF